MCIVVGPTALQATPAHVIFPPSMARADEAATIAKSS
jgi:hypothetical protein